MTLKFSQESPVSVVQSDPLFSFPFFRSAYEAPLSIPPFMFFQALLYIDRVIRKTLRSF